MTKQQAIQRILSDIELQKRICNHQRCKTFQNAKKSVLATHKLALLELA
jgi:hypothetical protein